MSGSSADLLAQAWDLTKLPECRISAKQWNTVAAWSWDTQTEACTICKGEITDTCIECRSATNRSTNIVKQDDTSNRDHRSARDETRAHSGEEAGEADGSRLPSVSGSSVMASQCGFDAADTCPIVWGACSHVFHSHCISRWLQWRQHCPLCDQEWLVAKTTENN
uniref:RING-type domain-containing protein n=1 Tax=Trypanosoma congolense (strain IL3000) TaxID=1068625 RepID=G0UM11_TRYCI|nr:conserved hypothetical protein [Trypanosoma congolense IL3000]